MASFTDDAKALSKFNPYIQQLPVEQMIDVGKRRQEAHQAGVEKIQTQIDNIAGLDVVRDVDKAYLQSKLNQLGNNLRGVAAGDFSNYQLINSVSGMTNQVVHDKGIQNGVQSAAKYRKEVAAMEAAEKEGKSSVSNKWVFGQDSSAWLNSDDVHEGFTTKYQPFVDVNKKWMEVMKSLHSDLQEQDIPYERNSDGSINYNKTAAAMQRNSKETVSASKIANALSASLTPNELNQLNIDGRYTFRGHDVATLTEASNKKFSTQISDNNDRIRELQGLVQLAAGDPERKKKAQDAIEDIKEQNIAIQQNYDSEVEMIGSNPEGAKGMLYKNGAISQFATANAWEHNKSNLLTNPVLEAEHWEKDYAMDKAKYALDVKKQNWSEYMDKAKYDLDVQKELREAKEKQIELYGGGGEFKAYGGLDTKVKNPLVAMQTDATEYSKAYSAGIVELVKAMPGTSSVQIKNAIEKFKAGDPNWFRVGQDSKTIIPYELHTKVAEMIKNKKMATRLNTAIKQTEAEVDASPEMVAERAATARAIKGLPPMVVTEGGRTITFSQPEILAYMKKQSDPANAVIQGIPAGQTGGGGMARQRGATKGLTAREQQIERYMQNTYAGQNIYSRYKDAAGKSMFGDMSKREDLIKANLLKKGGSYLPMEETITFGSDKGNIARRRWENVVNAAMGTYGKKLNQGEEGGTEEFTKDDYEAGTSWVSGKDREDIIYSTVTQGSKTFIKMSLAGKEVMVPIARDSVETLPNRGGDAPTGAYKDVVDAQLIGNGNTNPTKKFEDCYYDNSNIPGVKLNIGADLIWDKSNNASQFVSLKLNTPVGFMDLQLPRSMDRQLAMGYIQGLTDRKIKELYLQSPDIPDHWKEVIKKM